MARLYEYTDTNDKSGYFLRGGSSDGNYTMQATDLGKRLFDRLNYDPGIVNKERGPRIPSQLQWAMYEVGLLKTGDSEPSGVGIDGKFDAENPEITEEMMAELREFVFSEDSDRKEVQKLAEILDIDPDNDTQSRIWTIMGTYAETVSLVLERRFGEEVPLGGEESDFKIVSVHYSNLYNDDDETSIFEIFTSGGEDPVKHRHSLFFTEENEFEGILSMSDREIDWVERVRLERHRADIIEAVRVTAKKFNLYFGEPTDGPKALVTGDVDSETIHERA